MHFTIREPIWKDRSVGLNEAQLEEENTIEITYQKKDKTLLYPNPLKLTKREALKYPIQLVRGVRLRVVPLMDMEVCGELLAH